MGCAIATPVSEKFFHVVDKVRRKEIMAKIPTELILTVAVILGLGSIWLANSNTGRIFGLCCFCFSAYHLSIFYIKRNKPPKI